MAFRRAYVHQSVLLVPTCGEHTFARPADGSIKIMMADILRFNHAAVRTVLHVRLGMPAFTACHPIRCWCIVHSMPVHNLVSYDSPRPVYNAL